MSVESVTQAVSNLALAFGDDDYEGGVMVSRVVSLKVKGKGEGGVSSLISIVMMFIRLDSYLPCSQGLIHSNTISSPL